MRFLMKNNVKVSSLYRLAGEQGKAIGESFISMGVSHKPQADWHGNHSFFLYTIQAFPQVFSCVWGICWCRELRSICLHRANISKVLWGCLIPIIHCFLCSSQLKYHYGREEYFSGLQWGPMFWPTSPPVICVFCPSGLLELLWLYGSPSVLDRFPPNCSIFFNRPQHYCD